MRMPRRNWRCLKGKRQASPQGPSERCQLDDSTRPPPVRGARGSAASEFVITSALRDGSFVDDLPELIARVADHAPSRLIADIQTDVRLSGTTLFDTHPSHGLFLAVEYTF